MRYSLLLIAVFFTFIASAQVDKQKGWGDKIMNIQFHYTYMEPGGDLALRFGTIHNIGFGGLFKTRNHWVFALDGSYQFGTEVKEDQIFINLTNSSGTIMSTSGTPADYNVGQRGFSAFGKVGRLFPVSLNNRNSGFLVMAGAGMYYHKINITSSSNDIPTLTGTYKNGYDRLSSGPALTQFLGYQYHSHSRYYNFFIGVDFMEAFTKSIRGYNYDTMQPDTKNRLDITYGIRVGWMIPIYLQSKTRDDSYEFK